MTLPPRLANLPVHLLDLAFERDLQVVGPAVELLRLRLEVLAIQFGNHLLNRRPTLRDHAPE